MEAMGFSALLKICGMAFTINFNKSLVFNIFFFEVDFPQRNFLPPPFYFWLPLKDRQF